MWIVLALALQVGGLTPIGFPVIPSPTPVAVATMPAVNEIIPLPDVALDRSQLYNQLATAEHNLRQIESQPLPTLENSSSMIQISSLFSYGRWILEDGAAEIMGPFAPLAHRAGFVMTLVSVFGLIYIIVFLVVLVIKFIGWIISLVMKITEIIENLISIATGGIGSFLSKLLGG